MAAFEPRSELATEEQPGEPTSSLSSFLSLLLQVVDWDILGLHLSIPKYELDKIRKQFHHEGVERCKAEMIHLWLTNYCTTEDVKEQWGLITDALDKMKGLQELAEQIQNHCMITTSISSSNNIEKNEEERSVLVRVQKPYMKVFIQLESKFAKLITDTKRLLSTDHTPLLTDLHYYLKTRLDAPTLPPPHSLEELFDSISPHYCFLNVSLIENIINEFLDGSTVQLSLEEYEKQLEEFKTCTKMEELLELSLPQYSTADDKIGTGPVSLVLKLEGSWMNVTLKRFQQLIEEMFMDKSCYFNHIKVQKGCLEVSWYVPQSTHLSLLSLVKQRVMFMECVGVISVHINDEQVFSSSFSSDRHTFIDYLLSSISQERVDVIHFLIQGGYINKHGFTSCLELAVEAGNSKIVSLLLIAGANSNSIGTRGLTPLQRACQEGNYKVALTLLQHNADPNTPGTNQWKPLMIAAESNCIDLIDLLISHGANVNDVMENNWSALGIASDHGHISIVNRLLEAGANPNVCTDIRKWAPIHSACCNSNDDPSVLLALISEGADPNAITSSGATPLILATNYQLVNIVDILLDLKVSTLNLQSKNGVTPLMMAVYKQNMSILESLLSAGPDLYITDDMGHTALEWALQGGNAEIIQLLLVYFDQQTSPSDPLPSSCLSSHNESIMSQNDEQLFLQTTPSFSTIDDLRDAIDRPLVPHPTLPKHDNEHNTEEQETTNTPIK